MVLRENIQGTDPTAGEHAAAHSEIATRLNQGAGAMSSYIGEMTSGQSIWPGGVTTDYLIETYGNATTTGGVTYANIFACVPEYIGPSSYSGQYESEPWLNYNAGKPSRSFYIDSGGGISPGWALGEAFMVRYYIRLTAPGNVKHGFNPKEWPHRETWKVEDKTEFLNDGLVLGQVYKPIFRVNSGGLVTKLGWTVIRIAGTGAARNYRPIVANLQVTGGAGTLTYTWNDGGNPTESGYPNVDVNATRQGTGQAWSSITATTTVPRANNTAALSVSPGTYYCWVGKDLSLDGLGWRDARYSIPVTVT